MRVGRADGESWLRLGEAAALLGISINTLRRWSDAGKLTCYRSPGGHRRYRRRDVETLLQTQTAGGPQVDLANEDRLSERRETTRLEAPLSAMARLAADGVSVASCRFMLAAGDHSFIVAGDYSRDGSSRDRSSTCAQEDWVADEVLRTGRRMVIADLDATNLVPPAAAAAYRHRGHKAILALPMPGAGRIAGVMELAEANEARSFTGANVAFAEFVARQAGDLVAGDVGGVPQPDHAPAHDLAAALPVAPAPPAAAPPPDSAGPIERLRLLRTLGERLLAELGALACHFSTYDPGEGTIRLLVAAGETPATEGLVYDAADVEGLTPILAGGSPVERPLRDGHHAAAAPTQGEPTRATRVVRTGLRLGDEPVGLLEVYSVGDRTYEPGDLALIEAAAAAGALALAEHRDDAVLCRRVAWLDGIVADLAGHASRTDAEALVHASLDALVQGSGICSCTLYRVQDGHLVPTAWSPAGRPVPESLAPGDPPVAAEAIAGGATMAVTTGSDAEAGTQRFLEARGLSGALFRPLRYGDRVVGLLEAGTSQPAGLDSWRPVLDAVADSLAAALTCGDVIDRLQHRNRDLALVIDAGLEDTARLSTDEVLHSVVRRLTELTHTPVADIYAVEGDTLRALVSYDGGAFDEEWEGVVIPLSRYPCSRRAVDTGEIAVAASLDDPVLGPDGRYSLEKWGYQSQLSLPLTAGGRVLGLVELSDYVPRDFGAELELIRGLGQVAAHALENAALFEQVERRSRILNELVDLGALASRSRDIDALVRRMAERLLKAVDAANCDIFQVSDEGLRCVASYDRSGFDDQPLGRLLDPGSYPTLVTTMNAHEVLVINGYDDPKLSESERRIYREYGFASEVCIPLVVNDRLYGLIDMYDTRERDYTDYLGFLRSVGQTLAGALESSILFGQIEQRTKVLREIVELGAITSQTHDAQELLRTIAARLRDTIEAADCDIFTLQGDQLRCLVSADLNGFDEQVVGDVLDVGRFPATALAVHSGEPMIISSLSDPRLTAYERENYAAYGFQSELCIPLVVGERVIGLIDVFDTKPRDYAAFLDYLRSVGQMAAGAIENALLVEELERRNAALAELVELGRAVSGAADLDDMVRSVGPRIVDLMGAAGCRLFAMQDERLRCILTYENGVYEDAHVGRPLDLDQFPSTRDALERREVLVIPSPDDERLSDHERELYGESGSASEICVPLAVEDRVVGLLELYDTRRRDYAEYRDFLVNAAQTLAGAFENAMLLERLEQSNAMLNLLVESGLEFGATLELDPVLQSVARRLCAVTEAPNCDIYTIQGGEFRCVACVDKGVADASYVGTVYPLAELPLSSGAVRTRRPLLVTDIAEDPRLSEHERGEDLRWGHRAKLELPLVNRGQVVGIAAVYDDHPRDFEHLDLLQSLAQVAANALANATLFERLDRSADRMALVTDVSYELSSSLDLGEVLRSTANRLCAVADMPMCDIYTLQGDTLVDVVSIADGKIDHEWQGRSFPLSGWATLRRAVETRQPVSIETLDDPLLLPDERALMESYGETSELAVPLISKERVIGVLELLDRRSPRSFSPEEIDTVSAVCRVAALAIDNANLVENLQLRNRENELLNEIARATSASLNLPDIAAAAIDKLRRITPFDRGLVALRRDDQLFDVAYVTQPRASAVPETLSIPMSNGLLGRFRDEKVVTLSLPADLPAGFDLPGVEELRSAALIALTKGTELVGVLSLGSLAPATFETVDRHLLERTGTHLALAIDNARMYGDIKHLHLSNLKALSSALNAKDYYTLGHAARVAAYMVLLGEALGWPVDLLRQVEEAAYLHDIGKIGVSDRVLLKPSGLNAREWELMRQHPIFSADIIRSLFSEDLVLGVRHHHEHYGGGGYPDGLAGEDIPLIARAMCVVDSYDAMSFRRPYRQGLSYEECIAELQRCRGAQFDPDMVDSFIAVLRRLAEGRQQARQVAREAAARVDPEEHARLRSPGDEKRPEYGHILEAFREVCAANPPTRFISSHVRSGRRPWSSWTPVKTARASRVSATRCSPTTSSSKCSPAVIWTSTCSSWTSGACGSAARRRCWTRTVAWWRP